MKKTLINVLILCTISSSTHAGYCSSNFCYEVTIESFTILKDITEVSTSGDESALVDCRLGLGKKNVRLPVEQQIQKRMAKVLLLAKEEKQKVSLTFRKGSYGFCEISSIDLKE